MTDEIKELARAMNICKKQGLEYTPASLHNVLSNIKTSKAISECVKDFALKDIKSINAKIETLQTEIDLLEKMKLDKMDKVQDYNDINKKLQTKYNEQLDLQNKISNFQKLIN